MTHSRSDCDLLAATLSDLAALGRRMPPSWGGARVSVPVCGPEGQYVGRVLPGTGLYLPMDLKAIGITRGRLPHVFQASPVQRCMEALLGRGLPMEWAERGAITTYDGIIAARAGGRAQDVTVSKLSITTVANAYSSLFRADGLPTIGTYTNIPGGAAHSRASVGAWSFGLTNPTSPNRKYLLTLGLAHSQAVNMIILVDLLVAAGNIDANVATAQTINSVALPRYTSGAGVLMTFEVTAALGVTAANLTATYTNQAGAGSRSTGAQAMTTSAIVQRLQPTVLGPYMPLQASDFGVQSVQTVQLSAAMGAGGVLALNLYFPLAFLPGVGANLYMERPSTVQIDGLTELVTDATGVLGCLTAYVLANSASPGVGTYFLRTCEG